MSKLECCGVGMVICLEQGASGMHMVQLMPLPPIISCFIKIQIGLTVLVSAYPGCSGKEAIKQVFLKCPPLLCLFIVQLPQCCKKIKAICSVMALCWVTSQGNVRQFGPKK